MHLSIGVADAGQEDELTFEMSDNATEQEIEKEAYNYCEQWANNYIDYGAQVISQEPVA